jgi:hypothetical protein
MEPIESSETSASNTQKPGNYPKESELQPSTDEADTDLLITNKKCYSSRRLKRQHSTWNFINNNAAGRFLPNNSNKNECLIAAPISPSDIPDSNYSRVDVTDFANQNKKCNPT